MTQRMANTDSKLEKEILAFCKHIAGSFRVVGVCRRMDYASTFPAVRELVQILAVISDYQPRFMNYVKILDGHSVSVVAVDQWVFERDVERGFLGEALAGALIFPYDAMTNKEYFHAQELKLKKRLVSELLRSLILDLPELSYELRIRPEYFMYEAMFARGRLFPPTLYAFANLTRKKQRRELNSSLQGYVDALRELEKEGEVYSSECYWRISKSLAERARSLRARFTNLFRTGQRALFITSLGIFPQILYALSQNRETLLRFQKSISEDAKIRQRIENPESYIFTPTATRLVSLANRIDIRAFARKVLSAKKDAEIDIKNVGGILNDVYLVDIPAGDGHKKAIVKRFRDWSNFKWFPLTLWSVGTRSFAVSGISRLERECAINRLLDANGFAVPKLLHVSPSQRLTIMEYIEGENFSKALKRFSSAKKVEEVAGELNVVREVGSIFAHVHALNIALGDTKPENIFVTGEGKIYLMDFEQASRNGDIVWDVAEFLYYAGHDVSPFMQAKRLEGLAEAFIKGYRDAGGSLKTVKKAGTAKYTKVFSVFTFPHIILTLSNICRNADKLEA